MKGIRRAAGLTLALTLAGCGQAAVQNDPAATAPAMPAHVKVGGSAAPVDMTSCDPGQSLRPAAGLPAPGAMPAGTTMARIQARGALIVGVDQNTYPFGFRDATSGKVVGFDIELAGKIAQAIFGDASRLRLKVITNAQRIPAARSGAVDIVAHAMTMNCDRWKQVDFSTAYLSVGKRLLVRKGSGIAGLEALSGRRACAAQGTSGSQVIATAASRPTLVTTDSWTDCLVMLQQGQVDAIVSDTGVLTGLLHQDPNAALAGTPFETDLYGLAMSKNNPDLVRFVNGVLAGLRSSGWWQGAYNRWLATDLGPAAPPQARYLSR